MKAFILAAGLGTRLRPLTSTYAKPALPLGHKAMLQRVIEDLIRAGISDIRVNSHHLPETVEDVLAGCRNLGANLTSQFEAELLGTGGALLASEDWIGQSPLLIVNGDAVSDLSFENLIAEHRMNSPLATMALRVPDEGEQFGPVEVDRSGKVVRILEDGPTQGNTDVRMFCGIHILESKFLELLKPHGFSCVVRRGYLEALREGGEVRSFMHTGYFADAGTPGRFLDAHWHTLTSEHPAGTGHGPAQARGSTWWLEDGIEFGAAVELGARVSIGRGAKVGEGAYLEDTLVERGAVVEPGERLVGVIRLASGATAIR